MTPGSVLWLMRHELRLSLRGLRAGKGFVGKFVLWAFLGSGLLAISGAMAFGLSKVPVGYDNAVAIVFVSALLAALATFMLAQALIAVTDAMYLRGDLDLYLSSPIPPWRLLTVRLIAIAITVSALYLAFALALSVWLPFFGGWRWMGIAPVILSIAFAMTGIGLFLARLMFAIFGPRRTRTIAQVVAALTGGAVFLGLQAQNINSAGDRGASVRRLMRSIQGIDINAGDPVWIPARALLGDPGALIILIVFCGASFAAALWWFARAFLVNAASAAGTGGSRKRDVSARAMSGGLTQTLVRKEWRLLARDPVLLSQILLQLVYLLPLGFVMWRQFGQDGDAVRPILVGVSAVLTIICGWLASSLTWLATSGEEAPDLIAAAPVARAEIDRAKAIAAASPVYALALIFALAAALVDPAAGFWFAIGAGASIISSTLIGIWRQGPPASRKNFRRRPGMPIGVRIVQGVVMSSWAAATASAVGGLPLLSLIPGFLAAGLTAALHADEPASGRSLAPKGGAVA